MLITRIWESQPGEYFCISAKDHKKKWTDHFFKRAQFKKIKEFLEENKDKDLYWCPHGFSKPRRLKDYIEVPKLLWADLDEADPREMKPMPTLAWESSPGRFVGIWMVDGFINESINRRLSYKVGADKGGWDFTQVLRIPGTLNYKYVSTPKVKMLWSDGPSYKLKDIEKLLPKDDTKEGKSSEQNAAQRIYKKYEKKLNGFCRREILHGKPVEGKRSEIIWKLAHELIEAGMSRDEAFELLRVSPWNKFKGRRDGDDQLKRELNKALTMKLRVVESDDEQTFPETEEDAKEDEEEYKFLGRSMEDVEEENMDWIWYPYLARGEVSILEGDPGLGKSYLAQMVCGHIVDGKRLPSVKALKPVQGRVAYFDIENSSGTVTKKRLIANGVKNLKGYFQEEEPFSIDDEDAIVAIYAAIEKQKPAIVVFDTLNTYIGKADTHKSSETQQAFKKFVEIARRHNCAVLVLRHLTKSTSEKALYRGQGSIAFTGLARVVMTVGMSPDDDDTRVMAVTKINVTRPPKALTFTIKALPDTLKDSDRSAFAWGEFVQLSADDILVHVVDKEKGDKTEAVEKFLLDTLDDKPMETSALERAAEARGFKMRMVHQVAADIGIIKKKFGYGKKMRSMWTLPQNNGRNKRDIPD